MVEYIDETHTYLVDGVIVPSVTQILQKVFPLKYMGIPTEVLNNKARYGTQLHNFIEIIETKKPKKPLAYIKRYYDPNIYQIESIKQYLELKEKNNIEVIEVEKLVNYKNYYAGRLDIKALVNGKKTIIDIKTTAELDKNYVSMQNSLYELADEPVEELYCLWLPKGHIGKLEKLNRVEREILISLVEN